MKAGLILLGGFVVLAAACGGSVVFEEDGGDGGSGGAGANGSTGTNATSVGQTTSSVGTSSVGTSSVGTTDVGTSSVSVGTTSGGCFIPEPPPQNCQQACSDVFECGLQLCFGDQLCPAFFPGNKMQFMMGCMPSCQSNMALISIVDPSQCDTTIQTLLALNTNFEQICFGFGPDGP